MSFLQCQHCESQAYQHWHFNLRCSLQQGPINLYFNIISCSEAVFAIVFKYANQNNKVRVNCEELCMFTFLSLSLFLFHQFALLFLKPRYSLASIVCAGQGILLKEGCLTANKSVGQKRREKKRENSAVHSVSVLLLLRMRSTTHHRKS